MENQICIIDNYDSFTYNLVQLIREEAGHEPYVVRNDKTTVEELKKFNNFILSPGPGVPKDAGIMPELVKSFAESKKILGICLGHQCIGEVFGATLINMDTVKHGKGMDTSITGDQEALFKDIDLSFRSARYHSWAISNDNLPTEIEVTATDAEDCIMAIKHKTHNIRGLQFHPESILTDCGAKIINNWLNLC